MSVAAVWTARRWLLLTLVLSGGILFALRNRGWYPHDEGALGQSLAIVVITGAVIAFVSFRMALRHLAPAITARAAAHG